MQTLVRPASGAGPTGDWGTQSLRPCRIGSAAIGPLLGALSVAAGMPKPAPRDLRSGVLARHNDHRAFILQRFAASGRRFQPQATRLRQPWALTSAAGTAGTSARRLHRRRILAAQIGNCRRNRDPKPKPKCKTPGRARDDETAALRARGLQGGTFGRCGECAGQAGGPHSIGVGIGYIVQEAAKQPPPPVDRQADALAALPSPACPKACARQPDRFRRPLRRHAWPAHARVACGQPPSFAGKTLLSAAIRHLAGLLQQPLRRLSSLRYPSPNRRPRRKQQTCHRGREPSLHLLPPAVYRMRTRSSVSSMIAAVSEPKFSRTPDANRLASTPPCPMCRQKRSWPRRRLNRTRRTDPKPSERRFDMALIVLYKHPCKLTTPIARHNHDARGNFRSSSGLFLLAEKAGLNPDHRRLRQRRRAAPRRDNC